MTTAAGTWIPFKHLILLNYYLILLYTGVIDRLIVTMPPQHGKSQMISQYFICWWMGWRPDDQVAIVSYAAGVAEKFGEWCRDHFQKWGPKLFGLTVNPKKRSKKEWGIFGRRGVLRAIGMGGQLTSHRVDLGIIDDPIKGRKQSNKREHREAQKSWFRDEFLTRLSKAAKWIIVQTRWNEDDLAGYAETSFKNKIAVLHLPAIAIHPDELSDEEQAKYLPDALGREPGQALCPELHPIEQLEEARELAADGPDFWSIQQGIPRPGKGGIYDPRFWREFGSGQYYLRFDPGKNRYYYFSEQLRYREIFFTVDCSFKDTSRSDFVAIGVWAILGANLLLLDVFHRRCNLDDTCEAITTLRDQYPMVNSIIVEAQANGPEVMTRLEGVVPGLIPFNPQGTSKVERAEATRYLVKAGNLLLPPTGGKGGWIPAPTGWVTKYKIEHQQFPTAGMHDDQVDMTIMALKRLIELLSGSSTSDIQMKARVNTVQHALSVNRRMR